MTRKYLLPLLCFQFLIFHCAIAQDESDNNNEEVSYKGAEGFHLGFYIGGLFANKNSAYVYDGYGYDPYGNKVGYLNSYMYRKIVLENDPNFGYTDRIGPELGVVNYEDWRFSEDLMPTNLKYQTSYLLGLAMNYGFDKKQSVIFNFNFTKLKMLGNFTLQTRNTGNNQGVQEWTNHQFAISGIEQRLFLQVGYSRILGNNEKANFIIEGGLCVNYSSVKEHDAHINSLDIDLTYFEDNLHGKSNTFYTHYNGWGFGGFAGLGINLTLGPKYTLQLLYTPSYEKINNGPESTTGVQNAIGLRAYYNF